MSKIIAAFLLLTAFAAGLCAQNNCAKSNKKLCCKAKSFANCSTNGCGADVLLSAAKNRTDTPDSAQIQKKTIIQIANFTHPASWAPNTPRQKLIEWGEGTPLQVTLYLKRVKNYPDGLEACNCNLKGDRNNDYHLVLTNKPSSPETSSLTAEITPRIRPDKWTFERLDKLRKQKAYVRVTGWAMLDTHHVGTNIPKRKTHWEIHPVTKFEVCTTTKPQCDVGTGWVKLEEMP